MATPNLGQRIQGGLGRVAEGLFPVDPSATAGMDPQYMQQLRQNGMLQLGLGMVAAGRQPGATFGSALGAGLGQAQGSVQGAMQQAYANAMRNKADTRASKQEERLMDQEERAQTHQQWLEGHTLEREKTQDSRWQAEQDRQLQRDAQSQQRWEAEQASQTQWRQDQLSAREAGTVPAGYRLKPDGSMEAITGGPADPSGLAARKGAQSLRKEFRGLQTVKDYETTLPILMSAKSAPDTPQGDLQMIYTVGKILDPGSVVREGELELTQNAAPWLQKMVGKARAQVGQGRLSPEMRAGLIQMLDERVGGLKQAYDRDFNQYSDYAKENSLAPDLVVGTHALSAYDKPAGGLGNPGGAPPRAPAAAAAPAAGTVIDGFRFRGGDPSNKTNWEPAQ